jgi:ABC-type Fe3+-siderophore transport system permease subunit
MIRDNGYRQMMLPKTDDYLLDILKYEKPYYEAAAIADVENILLERGVNINFNTGGIIQKQKVQYTYFGQFFWATLIVGVILSILPLYFEESFYDKNADTNTLYYSLLILIRLVAMVWCFKLASSYNIYRWFWVVASFLFGGWALLFVSIDCWLSGNKK